MAVCHRATDGVSGFALILLSWQPVFEIFRPMLDVTLGHFVETSDKQRVITLYNALNAHDFSRPGWLCLWGQVVCLASSCSATRARAAEDILTHSGAVFSTRTASGVVPG